MSVDRFGNSHAPDLTYARGEILRSTEESWPGIIEATGEPPRRDTA